MDWWSALGVDNNISPPQTNFTKAPMVLLKRFLKREGRVWILSEAYLGRLDLASYDVYGTPDYWWAILAVNDIMDPWDKSLVGKEMFCPDPLDIHDFLIAVKTGKVWEEANA